MYASSAARPQKAAMLVAQRIVQDALRENRKPGDLLVPERTMVEKYGAGRGTVREALRLLEVQGVISLKPGPHGGPVLRTPDGSHLASTVVLLMQLQGAPFRTIVEVRSALEPMISSLAAARISPESLDDLHDTIDQMHREMDDQDSFLEANKRFHDVIARSSGNPLLGYMIESLLGIMDGTTLGVDYPVRHRGAIVAAHEEIFTALKSGDAAASAERMRRHIEAYERYAERKFPHVMDATIPWDQRFLG
jgi:GntR family transcriptional regulator, transcriptional repressor for pyruvate dehydrogenase complex